MELPDPLLEQPAEAPLFGATKPSVNPLQAWLQNHPYGKIISTIGALVVLGLISVFFQGIFGGISFFVPKNNYAPVYTLVNDKISQNGAIVVNLPKGVTKNEIEAKVSFDPVIKGSWVDSSLPEAVVYKPSGALEIGKHYLVSLATGEGTLKKDFLVDEDPAVLSIFPDSTAEALPASAITIVFNRPMVPLTTLAELDKKNIPVSISPATPGKFKWISTRTLQFIPQGTLYGSAHYTVSIDSSFVSMDGLTIPSKTYSFTTKQLRLDSATSNSIVYNQPISFYFNQPVDLQKISSEITLTNNLSRSNIEFVASYGKKNIWDAGRNANKEIEDKSIINLFPKNSLNGHSNIWDFSTSYTASINTAYPIGGDIVLAGGPNSPAVATTITTSPVLKNVAVQSDKTNLASSDLFDPAGTATFSFYENIDIGKSIVRVKGLKKIEYGKKCQEVLFESYFSDDSCLKVDNTAELVMSFDPSAYSRGERVTVTFERLINDAGYQVNRDPVLSNLVVYPELKITNTIPLQGSSSASVSTLVLCSTAPLRQNESKDFYKNFHSSKYIVFGRWDNSYLQAPNSYENPSPCAVGEYVNRIHYGLLPLQAYGVKMALEDVFGQKMDTQLSFFTEKAPEFYLRFQNLQKIYNVTTPEHTKLSYATENFDYVNMFICKVSPDSMVRILAKQPNDISTTPNSALDCLSSVTKKIALKDNQWVNQYFQVDIKDYFDDPRGQYILSFSHPQYQESGRGNIYARTYLSVTNLAVTDNRVKWTSYSYLPDVPNLTPSDTRGSVYWLSDMHSLVPKADAKISVYKVADINTSTPEAILAKTNTTNNDGFAEFPLIADVVGAAITSKDDTAVVSQWADTLSQGSWRSGYQEEKVYLYTDRPIYRPGQQVSLKGLYRLNFDGVFKIFRENDIKIEIRDSKYNTILTQNVPVSAYGTFSANITLPADAPLGTYVISARNNSAYFDVEEYVGAAFEAAAHTDKEEYLAGDTANIAVEGKYYFGVPLDGGTLDYSITSQDFYFDRYTDEYFNFGSNWYNCYDCGYGDTYLKSGKVVLDPEGVTAVKFPIDFNTLYKGNDRDQSKILVFHGTIKDKQGKSVSIQKSFIVHRGEYYIGVKADPSFMATKQPFSVRVKTVDVQGKVVSKSGIVMTVSKVGWQSNKRQEVDGGFYNRPQRTLTPVLTKNISTNHAGDYTEQVTLAEPGEYEINVAGKDRSGNDIKSTRGIYVYGEGSVDVQPTNNATLNLVAEKTEMKVGDTAKFVIQNPYPHAKALITIARGRIFTYEVVDVNQSIYEYQFPITEDYTPNVYASVVLLSPSPEVKFGQIEFTVDRKQKELTIDIQSNKKSYLPGEEVSLTINTLDAQGHPVPASVSIAVADVSVLALKGNPKKNPLVFFYDGFPLTVTTETNIKNLLAETPIPTGTKGGDGGSPADLATRKRGEFKDTAFWQAEVITNEQGVGQASFTLPDNLTKWQIESVGITKDTKLGVRYQEIIAQKEVMTVPIAPRFVVPGDEFMIGAKIFNQTSDRQSLTVALESATLVALDTTRSQKTIKAGETLTVYFKVKAPLDKVEGSHTFTLSAVNNDYNDTVERSLPITRNMTYESTGTAGSATASSTNEYVYLPGNVLSDHGGLTIKTNATLALYLSDAITYMFAYPYGCSEQLSSKLSAIAITKRALAIPNVGTQLPLPKVTFKGADYNVDQAVGLGLDQIYDNQTVGGGFSYYKGLRPDAHLTIQVVNTLIDIKNAGYSVRQNVIDQAVQYLGTQVAFFRSYTDTDTLILLAHTFSRAGGSITLDVSNLITPEYLNDKANSGTLSYLALLASRGGTSAELKEKVFATLINRVEVDSRGAYIKTNQNNFGWAYYETPEKDTALFLKALVADKRAYSQTDNIIRWLVASRAKDGSWGSTNTSVAALDALSGFLEWKRETESSFTLTTTLSEQTLSTTTFTKDNILSTIETFLPVSKIELNKTHTLNFAKTNKNNLPNNFYYDLSLKYYLPVDKIAPRDEGIALTREVYSLTDVKNVNQLTTTKVGNVVRGVITMIVPKERHFLAIEDYIPAGFELVNFNLATEDQTTVGSEVGYVPPVQQRTDVFSAVTKANSITSQAKNLMASVLGFLDAKPEEEAGVDAEIAYQKFYPDFSELRDDRLFLFSQNVQPGTYTYTYYLRATTPGSFKHLPAVASEMYFPENFGRTSGSIFMVEQ